MTNFNAKTNFQTLLREIADSGRTQRWIAIQLAISTAYVSRLITGDRPVVTLELAQKIIRLHAKVCGSAEPARRRA